MNDSYISHAEDDIAILMTHSRGPHSGFVHQLGWSAFLAGTQSAKEQDLYGVKLILCN